MIVKQNRPADPRQYGEFFISRTRFGIRWSVLRVAKGDLTASLFLAVFITGFFRLLDNINPVSGWPILTTIGVLSFIISAYLLQNQRKNQKKWRNDPPHFRILKVEAS